MVPPKKKKKSMVPQKNEGHSRMKNINAHASPQKVIAFLLIKINQKATLLFSIRSWWGVMLYDRHCKQYYYLNGNECSKAKQRQVDFVLR